MDNSYTFEFDEFVKLMKHEKILFPEMLFQEADRDGSGLLTRDQLKQVVVEVVYVVAVVVVVFVLLLRLLLLLLLLKLLFSLLL